MNTPSSISGAAAAAASEFLLLSRGQWDAAASKSDIESAIGKFYDWYTSLIASGRFRPGSRLTTDGAIVSRSGIATDGPFGEAKEVIGGFWIIVARSLREAAEIMADNPCLPFGLTFEIRPIETARASAFSRANETPEEG